MYRLHLSESVSSLSLLSPLLFISSWASGMDWGSGGCVERTAGIEHLQDAIHGWLGRGDFVACNASANMQDSLHGQGADGDCPSQEQVGLCFSSSELSISQPSCLANSCFWYHRRHIALQTAPNHWWRLVSLGAAYHMLLAGRVLLLTSPSFLQSVSCLFRSSQSCGHTSYNVKWYYGCRHCLTAQTLVVN